MKTTKELKITGAPPGNVTPIHQARREGSRNAVRSIPPRNAMEKHLAIVWADVLETSPDSIGVRDDFFELGGKALAVAAVITRIRKSLNIALPMTTLFKFPTIEALARLLIKYYRLNSPIYPFTGVWDKVPA